jgi:hypothetical protein
MRRIKLALGAFGFATLLAVGCQTDITDPPQADSVAPFAPLLGHHPLARPQTWADGELFNGVVTPATFHPERDPFDELYAGGNGFKDGVPLISESKPGDRDYNGGRWHMNFLKDTVDPDKYAEADRVEDLDLTDFDSTDMYFECPLLPRRGRN